MDVILRIFATVDAADACTRPKTETAMTIESDIRPEDYGRFPSPCYIVEERLLRRNLQLIHDTSRRAGCQTILAFKAFALWRTFPIFREYIDATTASSLYEARLAAEQFGSLAHTYSPAYTEAEFPEIAACSSHITFNSLTQYHRFRHMAEAAPHKVSCGLRINPEYSEIEVDLYNPCARGNRFGILAADMPAELPHGIEGFHCHCHCESDSTALAHTLQHIEARFGEWLPRLKWLNLGGGHLMTRQGYDLDLLVDTIRGLHDRYPNLQIILEPGSAFAWQTGPLLSQVVDVVENKGIRTAILNVSFTCHMPDCLEMPYQPTVRGAVTLPQGWDTAVREAPAGSCLYRLGGNSCLSGDFMGTWAFDHPLQVGEYILFEDMIHYTTVKTTMFNGIHHPAIAMLRADHSVDVLRRFSYEDYRDRMD